MLRPGNVASTNNWRSVLEPVIARYRDLDAPKLFRADAAFAIPELYELLETEGYRYAIRPKLEDTRRCTRQKCWDSPKGGRYALVQEPGGVVGRRPYGKCRLNQTSGPVKDDFVPLYWIPPRLHCVLVS